MMDGSETGTRRQTVSHETLFLAEHRSEIAPDATTDAARPCMLRQPVREVRP